MAEGVSEMGCRLDGDALTVLWMISFVMSMFGCLFCAGKLWRGLSGHPGGLLWNKVFYDTVFQVVFFTFVLQGSIAMYGGLRLFAGLYFLHDYLAVFLFCVASGMIWFQLGALGRLFRKMVKALVQASGSTDFKANNRRAHTVLNIIGSALLLPHFAGPALSASGRLILLRYFWVYMAVMGTMSVGLLVSLAHRGISVLKALNTDITLPARKKLQAIRMYYYFVCGTFIPAMLVLAVTDLIVDAPYLLGVMALLLGVGPLPRAAMLRFDMTKFRKGSSKRPASKRDMETTTTTTASSEKSTGQSSNEKSEPGLEAPANAESPITAGRRLGEATSESPVTAGRRLGGATSGDSWVGKPHGESELPRDSDMPHIIDVGK